ncbi:hypothetical protein W97_00585 [Coniosporium apollinis CBS 100218]|uniref:Uncharacterized protein n=1 Tax=Coniosporium apollinis (strain CBS 100218) TaxID=1168221 RepID=R7YI82_CONA1|nr:uncharacterized protein W97_00585 [Coniosporium apollinis CBS 100218]EON61371.1 hypothetical protein W97_00585 [Coniosporium apollinis CBS 100218]
MPFVKALKKDVESSGFTDPLNCKLAFDEKEVMEQIKPALAATVYKCKEVEIVEVNPNAAAKLPVAAQSAVPRSSGIDFANM